MLTARDLIERLGLEPHPEGGWYRETWREKAEAGRDHATAIHFLLEAGQRSHWHRVDAAEMWIFNAGGPLRLMTADDVNGDPEGVSVVLGPDFLAGHRFQHVFPQGQWQSAEPQGAFTLVTCVVAPGFDFAGFELAPPGWTPGAAR